MFAALSTTHCTRRPERHHIFKYQNKKRHKPNEKCKMFILFMKRNDHRKPPNRFTLFCVVHWDGAGERGSQVTGNTS
jgi:hypothetical protein